MNRSTCLIRAEGDLTTSITPSYIEDLTWVSGDAELAGWSKAILVVANTCLAVLPVLRLVQQVGKVSRSRETPLVCSERRFPCLP